MAFQAPTIPFKLTPEDMGAFNAPQAFNQGASVVDSMIAAKLKNLASQKAQAELPYAGLIAQADAASKLAYANLAWPQMVSKLISNPLIAATMSGDDLKRITGGLTGSLVNPGASLPSGTPNGSVPSNAMTTPDFSGGQAPSSFGADNKASDQEVSQLADRLAGGQSQADQAPSQQEPDQMPAKEGQYVPSELAQARKWWASQPEAIAQYKQDGFYTFPDDLKDRYRAANQSPTQDSSDASSDQPEDAPQASSPNLMQFIADQMKKNAVRGYEGNPLTGGGKGVGAGTTYTTPEGNKYSTPTSQVASQLQTAVSAVPRLQGSLTRLATAQAPFAKGYVEGQEYLQGIVNKYLPDKAIDALRKELKDTPGLNQVFGNIEDQYPEAAKMFNLKGYNKLPTLKARANAEMAAAPEQLLRMYGLKVTNYAQKEMKKIIKMRAGESPQDYQDRIIQKLEQLKSEELGASQQQLDVGLPLGRPRVKNQQTGKWE